MIVPPSSPPFAIPPLTFTNKAKRVRSDTVKAMKARKYFKVITIMDGFREYKLSRRGRRVMWRYKDRRDADGDGRWNRSGR
jgi:hypothetical protein